MYDNCHRSHHTATWILQHHHAHNCGTHTLQAVKEKQKMSVLSLYYI
jgi:hypothetical protein